jgi:hypothetical protein
MISSLGTAMWERDAGNRELPDAGSPKSPNSATEISSCFIVSSDNSKTISVAHLFRPLETFTLNVSFLYN